MSEATRKPPKTDDRVSGKEERMNKEVRYAKRKEIECAGRKDPYWDGKAAAYADMWRELVFGGNGHIPLAEEYNRVHDEHCQLIAEQEASGD